MQISLTLTGEKVEVLRRLREGSTQVDIEQRDCENAVRDALFDYLDANAAPGSVGVTVTISLNYIPAEPEAN